MVEIAEPRQWSTTRETYHHGTLREALVDAAHDIIRERGPEGFSLREATRRAGVSPGAPKHHFGSAEGLLTEVAIRTFHEQARFLAAVPITGEVSKDLRAAVFAYVQFAVANPGLYRLMLQKRLLQAEERMDDAILLSLEPISRLLALHLRVTLVDETWQSVDARVVGSMATVHGLAHIALDHGHDQADLVAGRPMLLGNSVSAIIAATWPDT